MEWNWFLFSFDGRINRAKYWFAALIWFATNFSFMTIFLFAVAGILAATDNDFHGVSNRTMHPAFYLLGLPLLVIGVWIFAATTVKRLHDRNRRAWWVVPFFIVPILLDKLWDWLDNPNLALVVNVVSLALSVWCFVELFCLKGHKGANRFGPDPLAPVAGGAPSATRRDQHGDLEFVALAASPSAGPHVKRER
jgi:uncharacterized membrane protein YhaH (DUF805 family)